MCIITLLSYCLAHFLHWNRGRLVYARIVWESHESWTYRCIFLSLFFLPSLYCISSYLIGHVLHSFFFILSNVCFASYHFHPKWWFSSVHCMEDSHVIPAIYHTDTDSKILSLRRSSHLREFWECVYPLLISYLGLICLCSGGAHLYICKKKMMNEKKRKISTCVYVHSILHHWACILMFEGHFVEYVCWWELVCELSETLHYLYSGFMYFESEMSDFLLRALYYCLFHHYIHCWCDFTSCLIWVDHYSSLCYLLRHHPRFAFDSSLLSYPCSSLTTTYS